MYNTVIDRALSFLVKAIASNGPIGVNMKKIANWTWMLTLVLLFASCGIDVDGDYPAPTQIEPPVSSPHAEIEQTVSLPQIEWEQITGFSMHWGDFHGGYQSFSIVKNDEQYLFNAHGCEMGVGPQMFVATDTPIPAYEANNLRYILESNNVGSWDGFSGGWCGDCTGDFTMGLSVMVSDEAVVDMFAGCISPPGSRNGFTALSDFLHDLAVRYQSEPEWGNLSSMTFIVSGTGHGLTRSITTDMDGTIFYNGRSPVRGRAPTRDAIDPIVMQQLHQLLIDYGVIQWWDGHRRDMSSGTGFYRVSISLGFDNDTGFEAWGPVPRCPDSTFRPRPDNIILPLCDATNAILDFIHDLEEQLATSRQVGTAITLTKWLADSINDWDENCDNYTVTVVNVEEGDEIELYALGKQGTILIQEIEEGRVRFQFTSDDIIRVHSRIWTGRMSVFFGSENMHFVTLVDEGPIAVWQLTADRVYP